MNTVVIGASTGIGLAVARMLAQKGKLVGISSSNVNKIHEAFVIVSKYTEKPIFAFVVDVNSIESVKEFFQKVLSKYGEIDAVINCAGISIHASFQDLSSEDFDSVIGTNLKGAFNVHSAIWPYFMNKGNGHIVSISSASGLAAYKTGSIYCASKYGLNGFLQALALEGQDHGIKITNICPGQVNTEVWNRDDSIVNGARKDMLQAESIAELIGYILERPQNEHFRNVIIHPFALQTDLTGRNRGPSNKFSI